MHGHFIYLKSFNIIRKIEILLSLFLGSMLPQLMALSVSFVCLFVKKKIVCLFIGLHCGCVPPHCENICARSLGYIHCGCVPPSVKICVSVRWVTLWVCPPLCVSVQLLTLACCLFRFAAFFSTGPQRRLKKSQKV